MTPCPKVLVIDDDRDVVRGVSLRLRAAGYETLAAYDGEQGVAAAKESHPDAIVLDVRMPHLDGLGVLNQLRHCNATRDIPVVMVSASLVDQQATLESGARFFLSKPYQPKTLLAAIESAIESASSPVGSVKLTRSITEAANGLASAVAEQARNRAVTPAAPTENP